MKAEIDQSGKIENRMSVGLTLRVYGGGPLKDATNIIIHNLSI